MTSKLTITRGRLEEIRDYDTCVTLEESAELARMALAVMDSEPVAYMYDGEDGREYNGHNEFSGGGKGIPLYRHAQPAPVVQCPFPCGWDNLNKLAIQNAAFVACVLVPGEPATESLRQAAISNNDCLLKVISSCRASMLKAGSDEIGSWANDKNTPTSTAMLQHQPQNEPQNIPEIIPGWIPVSERMPKDSGTYQVWNGNHVGAVPFLFGSFQCLNPEQVTHWMPTAKPPLEMKP